MDERSLTAPSTPSSVRVAATAAAGVALAGVLWLVYTAPFPLDEFCTRRRPTWVLGLFDTPRYTAVTGPVFLAAIVGLTALYGAGLWLAAKTQSRALTVVLLAVLPVAFVAVLLPGYPLLSNDIFKY